MSKLSNLAVIAAFAVGAAASLSASAATVFPTNSGTLLQVIPATDDSQSFSVGTANGGGYYYTFTTNKTYKATFTDTGNLNADVIVNPFVIETGATPGGTVVGTSVDGSFASGLTLNLAAGTYNLYVASTTPNEALSGTASVSAVPEPATWALLILGFGAVGAARRRARTPALAQA
jgi:hypothetical protein